MVLKEVIKRLSQDNLGTKCVTLDQAWAKGRFGTLFHEADKVLILGMPCSSEHTKKNS